MVVHITLISDKQCPVLEHVDVQHKNNDIIVNDLLLHLVYINVLYVQGTHGSGI